MSLKIEHAEALELIARIQRIIEQGAGSTEGSKVLAFNLIANEIENVVSSVTPKGTTRLKAYQVFGENGEDHNDIVFAVSRHKAKYESIAYNEEGDSYALIRAIRRPDLDQYAHTGLPDPLPVAP